MRLQACGRAMAERGGGRAGTWPGGRAAPGRPEIFWPASRAVRGAVERIRQWLAVEVGPGRLMPWLPVAFGTGILIYFTADHEPALTAALGLLVALVAATLLARKRPVAFPLLLGVAALAAGFATATLKSAGV